MMRLTLAAALCFFAFPAYAQMVCGPTEAIQERLEANYNEAPKAYGLAHNETLIEVWASKEGTFTVVMTRPNGLSCLMAVGSHFEIIKDPKPVGGLTSLSPSPMRHRLPARNG